MIRPVQARLLMSVFNEDNMEDAKKRADILTDSITQAMELLWILARDGPGKMSAPAYTDRVHDSAFCMYVIRD